MSRYTYDAAKVDSAITELNNALSAIADITAEFQAAANTITTARGAKYIDMDLSQLNQLQTLAEDAIENDTRTIQEKATVIEDYNNSGFFKKMFATTGMALTKFAEGVVSVGEDLIDGAVSIVGFTGGLFNMKTDS